MKKEVNFYRIKLSLNVLGDLSRPQRLQAMENNPARLQPSFKKNGTFKQSQRRTGTSSNGKKQPNSISACLESHGFCDLSLKVLSLSNRPKSILIPKHHIQWFSDYCSYPLQLYLLNLPNVFRRQWRREWSTDSLTYPLTGVVSCRSVTNLLPIPSINFNQCQSRPDLVLKPKTVPVPFHPSPLSASGKKVIFWTCPSKA